MKALALFLIVLATLLLPACSRCSRTPLTSKKVIRYPLIGEPQTLDATMATDESALRTLYQLQHGLVKHDHYGKVIPAIAERWDVSKDGKRYVFNLRPAKWSDGVDVRAQDFVFAWRRLLDPKATSRHASKLEGIEGAEAIRRGEVPYDTAEIGAKALSNQQLEVVLTRADKSFLDTLTHPAAAPQRQDVFQAHPDAFATPLQMRTTGPFVVFDWTKGSRLTLVANGFYYGQKSQIDRVELVFLNDAEQGLTLYEKGELDVLVPFPSGQRNHLRQSAEYRSVAVHALALGTVLVKAPGFEKIDLLVKPNLDAFAIDVFGNPVFAEARLKSETPAEN